MDSDSGAVTLSAIGRIKILISSADCLILDAMGGRGWVVPVEGFCCENELRRDCHDTIHFYFLIFPFPSYLPYRLSPHVFPLFRFLSLLSLLSPYAFRYSGPYLLSLILYLISI